MTTKKKKSAYTSMTIVEAARMLERHGGYVRRASWTPALGHIDSSWSWVTIDTTDDTDDFSPLSEDILAKDWEWIPRPTIRTKGKGSK